MYECIKVQILYKKYLKKFLWFKKKLYLCYMKNDKNLTTMKITTQNYKFSWGVDMNNDLYERAVMITTEYDADEQEVTVSIFVDGKEQPENKDTWYADDDTDFENLVCDYINDNLSWITECDDRFVINVNYQGDFCEYDLVD